MIFRFFVNVIYIILLTAHSADAAGFTSSHTFSKKSSLSNQDCIGCHYKEAENWQGSDHANAMALANKKNVKANFDNQVVEHHGQIARFYRDGELYMAEVSYGDKKEVFDVKFTFGHYPLQQYLVETEPGRLQVLPFAWDSRSETEGGQRWYHNYSHEKISPNDRLHWRQPMQNWNGMCADCHSDGLKRNYDSESNKFQSQWDNINVGCLSCHGDLSAHSIQMQSEYRSYSPQPMSTPAGQWIRKLGEKTATWQGKNRDYSFMDTCFACHSLRTPLADGITHEKPFLDQFMPQLLTAPFYHADGQIKEEVYVYGSFSQSKMFAAGVNCLDCHDKHTMKVKVEGNGLCLQCHSAEEYQAKKHHLHDAKSEGAQCVNCHMPETRYMGVDDRRDHSFKIPRPQVSKQFGTPNACLNCHQDKDNEWASNVLKIAHGKINQISPTEKLFMQLQSGRTISLLEHFSIIDDVSLPVITRATAIQLLPGSSQKLAKDMLMPYLEHKEGLLRLSAVVVSGLLPKHEQVKILAERLKDSLKSVRIEAARGLLNQHLQASNQSLFTSAFKELIEANQVSSWRGEGRLNQATVSLSMGKWAEAEESLLNGIEIDPYFEGSYINLAEVYRQQQRKDNESAVLKKALGNLPNSAPINYAYGLFLVRQQQHAKSLVYFKIANTLAPAELQYMYTYALALEKQNKLEFALKLLNEFMSLHGSNKNLYNLKKYLLQKAQQRK